MKDLSPDTKLITRAEWGARPPTSRTPFTADYGTTIHYNGPPIGLANLMANHQACFSAWRGIQSFHMGGDRGWNDIAYTGGACPHGFVFEGRWMYARTAANGTNEGNDTAYALFGFVGDGEAPTKAMKRALLDGAVYLRRHGGAGPGLNAHRNWKPTSCPGDPLAAWVASGAARPADWGDPFPLKKGDEGFLVLLLEIILVHAGFVSIFVDGKLGDQTMRAVHEFQTLLKLGQRDSVRASDFEAMNNWTKLIDDDKRPITLNDRGPKVVAIRKDLNLPPGNVYTTSVQDKVAEVQRYFGATPSGNADQETRQFIKKLSQG